MKGLASLAQGWRLRGQGLIDPWLAVFWRLIAPLQAWRGGSKLLGTPLLGGLLVLLLVLLPFLENSQTGLLTMAITVVWFLLWLTDVRPAQQNLTNSNQIDPSQDQDAESPDSASQSQPKQHYFTPVHTPLLAYWMIALVATALSSVRVAAFDGLVKLTLYMVTFARLNRVMMLGWRSWCVGAYLLSALAVCAYGVQQAVLGAAELATWTDPTSELAGITRVYSFLGNPNLLAGYLMPVLPLGLAAFWRWSAWGWRSLAGLVAVAGAYCLVQTQSRGGLLGLAAEGVAIVLLLVFWWGKRLPKWALPSAVGGMGGVFLLAAVAVPTLRKRLGSIFGGDDSSNAFRVNVWQSVINMIKAKPILGIGPGNKAFNQVYPLYQRSGFSALGAYSVPLELTVETGLIGVICYGWLVVTIFRLGWQFLNQLRQWRNPDGIWLIAGLATLVGMLVHGLVDTVWYRPQVQLLWWLCIALVTSFYGSLSYETASATDQSPDQSEDQPKSVIDFPPALE